MEKWASFTRLRLIQKAGRGMAGWVKRQQVRQTHKYMKERQHTLKRKQPTGTLKSAFFSKERASLCDLGGYVVQHLSTLYMFFFILLPERRGLKQIKLKAEGICVCVCEVKNGEACEALMPCFHAARNQQNKLPKSIMAAPA